MKKIIILLVLISIYSINLLNVNANYSDNNYSEIIDKADKVKNNASYLIKNSSYDTVGSNSTFTKTRTYKKNLKVGTSFKAKNSSLIVYGDLIIGTNATIDKDLIVYGNLKADSSLDVKGDIKVSGDIELGTNPTIGGNIYGKNIIIGTSLKVERIIAKGNLIIKTNPTINNGVYVDGYFTSGTSTEIIGKSKVVGNLTLGTNPTIKGVIYVYGDLKSGTSSSIKGTKIKITKNLYFGTNGNLEGRAYIYGKKYAGVLYNEKINNYTGFFGRIDPLLNYTYSEEKIIKIKNTTNYYLGEINKIQSSINWMKSQKYPNLNEIKIKESEKYNTYVKLFNYLEPFIEKESFDINTFSAIKKYYIGIGSTNIVKYKAVLPTKFKNKLNTILEKIPEEKKEEILNKVNNKINIVIEKLKKQTQTSKIIAKINLLLGVQEVIETKLDEIDDNIFSEIGL